jgi:hypothetical protein
VPVGASKREKERKREGEKETLVLNEVKDRPALL